MGTLQTVLGGGDVAPPSAPPSATNPASMHPASPPPSTTNPASTPPSTTDPASWATDPAWLHAIKNSSPVAEIPLVHVTL
jgi:hypothetical protein